jgi:hypothetical protein
VHVWGERAIPDDLWECDTSQPRGYDQGEPHERIASGGGKPPLTPTLPHGLAKPF